jgi:hypothetical protein
MHYRFKEGTAAIRSANDASSLMLDVFPVAVSRTIPKGFGHRSVAHGERWISHAGPSHIYPQGSHFPGCARPETNTGAAGARAPARCHSEPYAAGDVGADTCSGGARSAGSGRVVEGANAAAGRGSELLTTSTGSTHPLLQQLVHCAYGEYGRDQGSDNNIYAWATYPGYTMGQHSFITRVNCCCMEHNA